MNHASYIIIYFIRRRGGGAEDSLLAPRGVHCSYFCNLFFIEQLYIYSGYIYSKMKSYCHCGEHFPDNTNFCSNCGKMLLNSKCIHMYLLFMNKNTIRISHLMQYVKKVLRQILS